MYENLASHFYKDIKNIILIDIILEASAKNYLPGHEIEGGYYQAPSD